MKKYFSRFDWLLFFAILFLILISLGVVASVVPELMKQHLVNILIGLIVFFIFSQIDFRLYQRLTPFLYGFTLFLLVLPLIFGSITRGSLRWVQLGPFSFQPSEVVKPLLILFASSVFSGIGKFKVKWLLQTVTVLALPIILVFIQPDLGSSLVISITMLAILFASGIPWKLIGIATITVASLSPFLWNVLAPYQQQRIHTFLNPKIDPLGSGYNVIQSTVAVGSGQVIGRGLGRGTQSHLLFLPERHTDFVFAFNMHQPTELSDLGSAFSLKKYIKEDIKKLKTLSILFLSIIILTLTLTGCTPETIVSLFGLTESIESLPESVSVIW